MGIPRWGKRVVFHDQMGPHLARQRRRVRRRFWAPDGAYALISQIVLFAWIAVLSGYLAMRPSTARAPERAAVPAA